MNVYSAMLFLAISATMALTAVAQQGRGGGEAVNSCTTQFPTAATDLTAFASTGEATNDLKCFMSCVMLAKGLMTSAGSITVGTKTPPSVEKTQSCFGMTPASDLCETAYQHNKCMWENDSNRMFLKLFQQRGMAA